MRKFYNPALVLALLALSAGTGPSFASEMGLSIQLTPKKQTVQPTRDFPGKLRSSQFISSVDGAQNSWRSVLRDEGDGVRIGLKIGQWERPDPQAANTVWLANTIDWSRVAKRNRNLEFTYTFGESTAGVESIFKFGASAESVTQIEGDCSLVLIYGGSECTFRRGSESTSGQLPFTITKDTTVRIRIISEEMVDIWIDDLLVLADQAVDLDSNLVGFIADTDSPDQAHFLHIAAFKAELVRSE